MKYSDINKKIIKRIAYYKVKEIMDRYQIPILVGLRRTGKTTILNQIKEEYGEAAVVIPMDRVDLIRYKDEEILSYIENFIIKGYEVILLDEIQIREEWDLIVKNLFDKWVVNEKIKVVVTGSSSLSFESKDTGVDRTKKVLISTLDFHEYLNFTQRENTYEEFESYLGRGAYPKYVGNNLSFEEMLELTLSPILKDDIAGAFGINLHSFFRVIYYLVICTTGEFNRAKTSAATEVSATQIDKYLEILEKTHIIKLIYQVDEKGCQSRNRKFKVYINPHFHLWLLGKSFQDLDSNFKGHIIESYWLFVALQINGYYKTFYYLKEKKSSKEIDFVTLSSTPDFPFKSLHEFKYSGSASSKNYHLLNTIKSLNKVVWCKENHKEGLITFQSIKDYKNEAS